MSDLLTTTDVGRILGGIASWRVRRAIDSLDVAIPRVGRYRLVSRDLLGIIAVELHRRKWLPSDTEVAGA